MQRSHVLFPYQVVRIRERFAQGEPPGELAQAFRVTRTTIDDIVIGLTHRFLPGPIVIPVFKPKGDVAHYLRDGRRWEEKGR